MPERSVCNALFKSSGASWILNLRLLKLLKEHLFSQKGHVNVIVAFISKERPEHTASCNYQCPWTENQVNLFPSIESFESVHSINRRGFVHAGSFFSKPFEAVGLSSV
jgi:hypothetical protein